MKVKEETIGKGLDHFCTLIADGADKSLIAMQSKTSNGWHKWNGQSPLSCDYEYALIDNESDYQKMKEALERLAHIDALGGFTATMNAELIARMEYAQSVLDSLTGEDERVDHTETLIEILGYTEPSLPMNLPTAEYFQRIHAMCKKALKW